MKVKVKICGIRTLESAQTAINAGADFLGFNFVITSKRYIKPATAKKIIDEIKISLPAGSQVKTVGVFQNNHIGHINKLINFLDLDFIQLHEKRTIKSTKGGLSYQLIDRNIQGTGQIPDLEEAKKLVKKSKIFFAGGLNPKNVVKIIKKVKPYAVDVAGGIETNGIQDDEKIKSFVEKVKGVTI